MVLLEILIEFIAEFLLEGMIEGSQSSKVPRILRLILSFMVFAFYLVLAGALVYVAVINDNIIAKVILYAVALLIIVFIIKLYSSYHKIKSERLDNDV